jgi:hypothetical protein
MCPTMPVTGIPVVDTVLSVIGALYVIASAVGNVLPHDSKTAKMLGKFALNLHPAPKSDQPPASS